MSTVVKANNLARLKSKTISWARIKQKKYGEELKRIVGVLKQLEETGLSSYASSDTKDQLIQLEREKIRLLR